MTDGRYIDIREDLLHDLEEHDCRRQPGDEIYDEATTAIIRASGLPPEDEPESEPKPEQPIPEPDPEEPLPVPPNLDPGIVAVASRKPTARITPG